MPLVDQAFIDRVSGHRYVVLLALTDDQIETGLKALRNAGFSYKDPRLTNFQGKTWSYFAAIIAPLAPERR
jgi:hypothetical protein